MLTTPRRLALLFLIFLAWAPAAHAWSWPVQGPVTQPFAYDEAHPYAAGQHRGIDIGADAAGQTVVAPAAGIVSFAGSVAANGKSVTIETADGYSVTLTHLGSIVVARGATVAEEDAIGTVGPSGTPEVDGPYVHLGIRLTADTNGYVDPLSFLPAPAVTPAADTGSTTSRPSSSHASSPVVASKPAARASSAPRAKVTRVTAHEDGHAQTPRADPRPVRSADRPSSRDTRATHSVRQARSRPSQGTSPIRRPLAEPGVSEPIAASPDQPVRGPSEPLLGLLCNCLAALFAVGAALAAGRKRRRLDEGARVLHLSRPMVDRRRLSRAA